MLKPMNVRKLTRRHICSIKGCGNRDTVLVARSQDLYGGMYICRDCVAALADHFGIAADVEADSSSAAGVVAPAGEDAANKSEDAPVNEGKTGGDAAAEVPKATKAGKSSSKKGDK